MKRTVGPCQRDTCSAAHALLDVLEVQQLPQELAEGLRRAAQELHVRAAFSAQALLVDSSGVGHVLGLSARPGGHSGVTFVDDVAPDMLRQAGQAWSCLSPEGARLSLEWAVPFLGQSIGASVLVAALVAQGQAQKDPLLAATGAVDLGGHLVGVEGIPAKLRAAAACGIRRVLVAPDNLEEARELDLSLDLITAERADGVARALRGGRSGEQLSFAGRVGMARALCPEHGLGIAAEQPVPHGLQLRLHSIQGTATMTLFESGAVVVGGKAGEVKVAAEQLKARVEPVKPEPRPNQTITIATAAHQQQARTRLLDAGAQEESPGQHERWRLLLREGSSEARVVLYNSGKCVFGGKSPAWETARSTVGEALKAIGGEALLAPAQPQQHQQRRQQFGQAPWIGTDESGKGDYFGPLVSAAVAVDQGIARRLTELGVTDSKRLSDKRVLALAPSIRQMPGLRHKVTPIHPKRFNSFLTELNARGGNLNTMLAWGHSRSIETVLQNGAPAEYAIVDQFGQSDYIERELLAQTKQRELVVLQWPKAEADVAVAAASVLAREAFLLWLQRTGQQLGLELPKGAGDPAKEVARALVQRLGEPALSDYVKVSFKTTRDVIAGAA